MAKRVLEDRRPVAEVAVEMGKYVKRSRKT